MRTARITGRIIVAALALFLFGCRTTTPPAGPALARLFDDLYAKRRFSGAVVVSGRDGIIFAKGYGYASAAQPA